MGATRPQVRVFVASASGALQSYRDRVVHVCHRLGLTPVHAENFRPGRPPALEHCRCQVESCDVFVLLLAHRYGERPPDQHLSYPELEYEWALANNRMALLPYVIDEDYPWVPAETRADIDQMARFRDRVKAAHAWRAFGDPDAFQEDVLVALSSIDIDEGDDIAPHGSERLRPPAFQALPPYAGNAPFTGRQEQLALLDEWAGSGDPVLVVEAIGGTGKSALTWEWAGRRAPTTIDGLAGRFWWSFYERSASMAAFLRALLAYVSDQPDEAIDRVDRADLADRVIAALRSAPHLVVLDGVERLLAAYHRFDPTKLRDDDVETTARSLIEVHAADMLRRLATASPSRILVSTRLRPEALEGFAGHPLPGVRELHLPGLDDAETVTLLSRLGVSGSEWAISSFFGPLENHPLLIGVVAGLVRNYRTEPGDFDRWLADPTAGGAVAIPDLDLVQRRTHILAFALADLKPAHQRLLSWISVLPGSVDWPTLESINPFLPDRSVIAPMSQDTGRAVAQLDRALTDLHDRGLLWWERGPSGGRYDMHPIVRAHAHELLETQERIQANDRIRSHFENLPPDNTAAATTVEDLQQTITIFGTLASAGHEVKARIFWRDRLHMPLLHGIGAHAAVIELLTQLPQHDVATRQSLATALYRMGRYEEALVHERALLERAVAHRDMSQLRVCLQRVSNTLDADLRHAEASRYRKLLEPLVLTLSPAGDEHLYQALRSIDRGDCGDARWRLDQAERTGKSGLPMFGGDVTIARLRLAERAGLLTESALEQAQATVSAWSQRADLAGLAARHHAHHRRLDEALAAVQEQHRIYRAGGIDTVPAFDAWCLAELGRHDEACDAVTDALARINALDARNRPHRELAQALHALGREEEAAEQAQLAYRLAWGDGPPNVTSAWDLEKAVKLLDELGLNHPALPTVDPSTINAHLEVTIATLIRRGTRR